MTTKRVVITGLGAVTPVGNDVRSMWASMMAMQSGAAEIKAFDASLFKTRFACEVKDFDISCWLDRKEARKLDRFTHFAVASAEEAFHDSGLEPNKEPRQRMGVIWGSGMGGLIDFETGFGEFITSNGTPHFNPFYIPKAIINIASGYLSLRYGLQGPCYGVASACASSGHAIAAAVDCIRLGRADVMLAGGSDADITYSGVGGFNALHALSTQNDHPASASCPFSRSRDGFVLGEGGACLVLEEYEHAVRRGATIYAELAGVGINADAYHMTAPEPTGQGAMEVMRLAIEDAGVTPADIDYINAHGTSTRLGDLAEIKAIQQLWGDDVYRLNISSTKSMMGHTLGAAAAIEAVTTIMALREGIVPPTINHAEDDADEEIDSRLNLTFNAPQKRDIRCAISNSFGFGGQNVCLLFKQI